MKPNMSISARQPDVILTKCIGTPLLQKEILCRRPSKRLVRGQDLNQTGTNHSFHKSLFFKPQCLDFHEQSGK